MPSGVKFMDIPYSLSPDIPYIFIGGIWSCRAGPRSSPEDQNRVRGRGCAVEDEDALLDADEPDLLGGERSGYLPAPPVEGDLAGLFQPVQFGMFGVQPRRRVGIVGVGAGLPQAGRSPHPQRLVGTDMVVILTEVVQPALPESRFGQAAQTPGLLQRAMEALYLALRLRMPEPGQIQAHALLHQPHGELRPAAGGGAVPPRNTVVHQHRLGQAAVRKGLHQLLAHGLGAGGAGLEQGDGVAAVIVDHRQGTDRLIPALGTLEVHLPELVGLLALESPGRRSVAILDPDQPAAVEDAMHGGRWNLHN